MLAYFKYSLHTKSQLKFKVWFLFRFQRTMAPLLSEKSVYVISLPMEEQIHIPITYRMEAIRANVRFYYWNTCIIHILPQYPCSNFVLIVFIECSVVVTQQQDAVFLIIVTINNATPESERLELKTLATSRLLKFMEYQAYTVAEHIAEEHYE